MWPWRKLSDGKGPAEGDRRVSEGGGRGHTGGRFVKGYGLPPRSKRNGYLTRCLLSNLAPVPIIIIGVYVHEMNMFSS